MATRLYRIGGWSFKNRRKVLVGWLLVVVAVFASAAMFSGKTSNKFSVPGTESQVAMDLLEKKFPAAGGGSARVVFAAPEGEKLTDPENRAAVTKTVERAAHAPEVVGAASPYETKAISKDGRIGFADVFYPVSAEESRTSPPKPSRQPRSRPSVPASTSSSAAASCATRARARRRPSA
jgi:uncharacterized membrane protein YdfJ with MMPL/SSD domain